MLFFNILWTKISNDIRVNVYICVCQSLNWTSNMSISYPASLAN